MKKYGKLIIAFMWLGLTMIMIVGATFAWFSENRTVEAGGMSVNAEASKNLVISDSAADAYDFSATSDFSGVQTLSPCSTINLTSFFATSDGHQANYDGTKKADATFISVSAVEAAPQSGKTYVVKHSFNVKVEGATGAELGKLYVSELSVGAPAQEISKAIRVGVKCGSITLIYAPLTDDVVSGSVTTMGITSTAGATASQGAKKTVATASPFDYLTSGNVTTTPVLVEIFVWYEGQDSDCTSSNSINVEEITISIKFTAEEPAA